MRTSKNTIYFYKIENVKCLIFNENFNENSLDTQEVVAQSIEDCITEVVDIKNPKNKEISLLIRKSDKPSERTYWINPLESEVAYLPKKEYGFGSLSNDGTAYIDLSLNDKKFITLARIKAEEIIISCHKKLGGDYWPYLQLVFHRNQFLEVKND